jgi:hypothetical protein
VANPPRRDPDCTDADRFLQNTNISVSRPHLAGVRIRQSGQFKPYRTGGND